MAKKKRVPTDPKFFLKLASKHLKRVQAAKEESDWSDIGTYGLYCLEALVRAAALKSKETPVVRHWEKADQARKLAQKHKLPDVSTLLSTLNSARKANAYGDEDFDESEHDLDDIVEQIENYNEKVAKFVDNNK